MSAVLIVESQPIVTKILKQLLGASGTEVATALSVHDAKRSLVAEQPKVIILALAATAEALTFATGLRDHPVLREIPLVLCANDSDGSLERQAKAAGFAAVVAPDGTALRAVLAKFLPRLVQTPEEAPSREQHFQAAQKLLAQVLHNLKTSNLLDVASAEDVPRIVSEITRKVCDGAARGSEKPAAKAAGAPGDRAKGDPDTIDLSAAFSKKV